MADTPAHPKTSDLTRSLHTQDESAKITASIKDTFNSAESLPEQIGDYRILAKLGEGDMGAVYRAQDVKLKREVALKVMRPDFAAHPIFKFALCVKPRRWRR